MIKLALCMITAGDSELKSLKNAVNSVVKYVDEVHITANGPSKQLKKWCKQNGYDFTYKKWGKNFAEQRNFNFGRVSPDVDYIWWLDYDDIVVGAEHIRDVAEMAKRNGKDAVFFTYWYGCEFNGEPSLETFDKISITQKRERLLRPGAYYWSKRIHETPMPTPGSKNNYTQYPYDEKERPIAVMHLKTKEGAVPSFDRNRELLELELADERAAGKADPRTILYLMKIYNEIDDPEVQARVLALGEEYLQNSGWDEERCLAHNLMAICLARQEKYEEAVTHLLMAMDEYSPNPITYIRLGLIYVDMKRYREAAHWLQVALTKKADDKTGTPQNIEELRILLTQLMLKLKHEHEKDHKAAAELAKILYELQPNEANLQNVEFLETLSELNEACRDLHKVCIFLQKNNLTSNIVKVVDAMPPDITQQPFAVELRQRYAAPRVWGNMEICYFANFGGPGFEQWSPKNLEKGIGGSETAVIELAKRWTKMGFKVTVYGDPKNEMGDHDGVTYLPWYYFNRRDTFNILVQWRGASLAGQVVYKKLYIDLHDVYNAVDIIPHLPAIDGIFVKSDYHKSLGEGIPPEKFIVINNGINL